MRFFSFGKEKLYAFSLLFLFLIFVSAETKIKNKPLLKSYFYYLNLGLFLCFIHLTYNSIDSIKNSYKNFHI